MKRRTLFQYLAAILSAPFVAKAVPAIPTLNLKHIRERNYAWSSILDRVEFPTGMGATLSNIVYERSYSPCVTKRIEESP
jgi:hypothetical protein